jgi:predicted transposase/invertase (TIGR01784 family)
MKYLFSRFRLARKQEKLAQLEAAAGKKPVSILEDGVFKAMLTQKNEDSREALRSLISACLKREVSNVQVKNNEISPLYLKAKSTRLDVHVTFNDGETVALEMQTSKTDDDLKRRAEYYADALVASQEAKGFYYSDIKRVYQIFFFDCELFPDSGKLPRRYYYQEENEHDRLSDLSEIIFYELPKLEQWFKDFIQSICQKEEGIMRAERTAARISRNSEKAARKLAIWKNEIERSQLILAARDKALAEGRAEGIEKGRAEGIEKGKAEGIAEGMEKGMEKGIEKGQNEKALEIGFNLKNMGLSTEQIAEATGLLPEEVEKLN